MAIRRQETRRRNVRTPLRRRGRRLMIVGPTLIFLGLVLGFLVFITAISAPEYENQPTASWAEPAYRAVLPLLAVGIVLMVTGLVLLLLDDRWRASPRPVQSSDR